MENSNRGVTSHSDQRPSTVQYTPIAINRIVGAMTNTVSTASARSRHVPLPTARPLPSTHHDSPIPEIQTAPTMSFPSPNHSYPYAPFTPIQSGYFSCFWPSDDYHWDNVPHPAYAFSSHEFPEIQTAPTMSFPSPNHSYPYEPSIPVQSGYFSCFWPSTPQHNGDGPQERHQNTRTVPGTNATARNDVASTVCGSSTDTNARSNPPEVSRYYTFQQHPPNMYTMQGAPTRSAARPPACSVDVNATSSNTTAQNIPHTNVTSNVAYIHLGDGVCPMVPNYTQTMQVAEDRVPMMYYSVYEYIVVDDTPTVLLQAARLPAPDLNAGHGTSNPNGVIYNRQCPQTQDANNMVPDSPANDIDVRLCTSPYCRYGHTEPGEYIMSLPPPNVIEVICTSPDCGNDHDGLLIDEQNRFLNTVPAYASDISSRHDPILSQCHYGCIATVQNLPTCSVSSVHQCAETNGSFRLPNTNEVNNGWHEIQRNVCERDGCRKPLVYQDRLRGTGYEASDDVYRFGDRTRLVRYHNPLREDIMERDQWRLSGIRTIWVYSRTEEINSNNAISYGRNQYFADGFIQHVRNSAGTRIISVLQHYWDALPANIIERDQWRYIMTRREWFYERSADIANNDVLRAIQQQSNRNERVRGGITDNNNGDIEVHEGPDETTDERSANGVDDDVVSGIQQQSNDDESVKGGQLSKCLK